MCVIAVVMLYPFFYMLDNAFRNQSQFARESGHSSVSWGQLFTELPVWRELLNSTLICTSTILRIALPLSWPALATVTVLQFIQIWDDLLVGLLFLQNPQQRTITVGLAALSAGRTTSIPVLMAGSFVSALPAITVYLIFQRHLVKGLTMGMGK